ncbi:kinase-like domain-containing protein [Mycena rosella]|uniref:Kinase-like domain-containing protein n=1 Tax=Mycena rosella TaxID=1033263 RepID=A0AAD7E274_MYCRO|nr:kinase-like domain-containing protein [Mycena rosella]
MIPELARSPRETGFSSPPDSHTVDTPFIDHSDPHSIHFNPEQDLALRSPRIHPYRPRKELRDTSSSPSPPQRFFHSSPRIELPPDTPPASPSSAFRPLKEDDVLSASTFSSGYNSEPHPEKPRHSHRLPRASSNQHLCSEPSPSKPLNLRAFAHFPSKPLNLSASAHSPRFPPQHELNPFFVRQYHLEDELGSGGYGFVMTAVHLLTGTEVAVKFILKEKVPDHSWMEDQATQIFRRLPTEVMLLRVIEHENIVKCLGVYEDHLYYYLIQELHGTPWHKAIRNQTPPSPPISTSSLPSLSPSVSADSITLSEPATPPTSAFYPRQQVPRSADEIPTKRQPQPPPLSLPPTNARPEYSRRPSHDLFECIEQTEHKRLSEDQARYVLAQVVEAIYYLDCHGVTHRDIKDENLVIDEHLKVKLIDFGSAVVEDPNEPRPYHALFYGTTAYASPEILLKKRYQAPPAEVWTIGVLLSFLLTGSSPFPTVKDAISGNIILTDCPQQLSRASLDLMSMCLDPNPKTRATIGEVRTHRWLNLR